MLKAEKVLAAKNVMILRIVSDRDFTYFQEYVIFRDAELIGKFEN